MAGLLSLRDLVVSDPQTRIDDIMLPDCPSVQTDTTLQRWPTCLEVRTGDAAVVDGQHRVLGVITVDDVMELVILRNGSVPNGSTFPSRCERILFSHRL